jgi:hypothetical protein
MIFVLYAILWYVIGLISNTWVMLRGWYLFEHEITYKDIAEGIRWSFLGPIILVIFLLLMFYDWFETKKNVVILSKRKKDK